MQILCKIAQRRFAQSLIVFRQHRSVYDKTELINNSLLLNLWLYLNPFHVCGHGIKYLLTISFYGISIQALC